MSPKRVTNGLTGRSWTEEDSLLGVVLYVMSLLFYFYYPFPVFVVYSISIVLGSLGLHGASSRF